MSIDNLGRALTVVPSISADAVPERLDRHLGPAGLPLVLDLHASRGSWLVDGRDGTRYLDLYTFFASAPLGCNPPELVDDHAFMKLLGSIAANKPANCDLYSVHLAAFTETFVRVLGDPEMPYLFFIEGGALAVETALKCAFDWKSRCNERAGRPPGLGTKAMHLRHAFHGRSGYTLSLTNTDPVKTDRFPQFDWPRIDSPAITFPAGTDRTTGYATAELVAAEQDALSQAEAAFTTTPHDVACFIAEPIQCEGGDRHLRPEFLQAMERLCHRYEALFILDEVQTGVGGTGTAWAYTQMGLRPDVVAFSKKLQVGGVMAGRRVCQEPANVFAVPGRISSTWGGGLVDMVRAQRYLEIIERDGLIERAARLGSWFLAELHGLADRHASLMRNVRGRGLIMAFDLPNGSIRDEVLRRLMADEQVLAIPGGDTSVRLRPALTIGVEDLRLALAALDRTLDRTADAAHGAKVAAQVNGGDLGRLAAS